MSRPLEQLQASYDVVVVGSGYGGGIAASRMARAGRSVCVLERGKEFLTGEFPDTRWEAMREFQIDAPTGHIGSRTGLYDLRANEEISVFMGCGLGGTSLVNANVSLRPDPRVFEDPVWPAALRDDVDGGLAEGFRRAETMLRPTPYPAEGPTLHKLAALERSAEALGARFYRPPINVTFEDGPNAAGIHQAACNRCGNCVAGCNVGAKNTVAMTYLPDAHRHGASVFTEVAVRRVSRADDGQWVVHVQPRGLGRERWDAPELIVRAPVVVLAGGSLGSTEVLLRSRDAGLPVSGRLGHGFTGNGDVLGFAYNCDEEVNGIGWETTRPEDGDPNVGPTITGIIDVRDRPDLDEGIVIEEGAIPGSVSSLLPEALAAAGRALGRDTDAGAEDRTAERDRERDSLFGGPRRGAAHNTQTFLVMAHDDAGGTMHLDDDRLRISWPGVGEGRRFHGIDETLDAAVVPLGGTYLKDPLWTKASGWDLVTVHPLGGCPMGEDAEHGVVDERGRVFAGAGSEVHEGLYVLDGSIVPRSLGVNPLLTISALAERGAALIAADRGWAVDDTPAEPLTEDGPAHREGPIAFQTSEHMEGFIGPAEAADFEEGLRLGEQAGTELSFLITLRSVDLDAMLDDDPDHGATIVGTVTCPSLSAQPLTITGGTFTWFGRNRLDPGSKRDKEMRYAMTLHSEEGRTYRLEGLKVIHDDPGFDLWSDTTRLFVTVKEGESPDGPVLGRGILHMTPDSLVRSLTTFRVSGPHGPAARLAALTRFGWFFSGNLFTLFGGLARKDEPSGALSGGEVRVRRSLRAPVPSVHTVTTKDDVKLRLTRYQGGTKGPVIVAHGFGMSSRMFSLDTVETNLVEHLVGSGYDTWLFDWRGSIDLPASRTRFDADRVALADWPAAIRTLRELTGAEDVQAVVHCIGSMTFFMSMLAGLPGIRSVVSSQLATHLDPPPVSRFKGRLHVAEALSALGMDSLDAFVDEHPDWTDRLWNQVVALQPIQEEERCDSAVCHRLTFMYGLLYEHDRLNSLTHATLSEQVGLANLELFEHVTRIARVGHVVLADGTDTYLDHLDRMAVPTLFLHGAESGVFEPSSTERTQRLLAEANGADLYRRVVLDGYGHLDTWLGKDAGRDVYPLIVEHLDRTNS